MLLFGKHSYRAPSRQITDTLAEQIFRRPAPDLETSRVWLIVAGQLEQAILDLGHPAGAEATSLTRLAARVFLSQIDGVPCAQHFRTLAESVSSLADVLRDTELELRTPEGFAWYALYPDAYARTSKRWANGREGSSVGVIGIRSIGTTLAGVTSECLARAGMRVVACTTARPYGDPFARDVDLPALPYADHYVVVDEGPGLSGSSMVAVARSLVRSGVDRDAIAFFAGHENGPGYAASDEIRGWWSPTRVWSCHIFIRADLFGLEKRISGWTGSSVESIELLDTSRWLQAAGLADPPRSAVSQLETPKKIVRLADGRKIVLKYTGLVPTASCLEAPQSRDTQHLVRLAHRSLTVAPLGGAHGWLALPWIEGRRLTGADASAAFIRNVLATYIVEVAKPYTGDPSSAIARIRSALLAWARQRSCRSAVRSIEQAAAFETERLADASQKRLAAGDGRLAPHEWIKQIDGKILKVDCGGHDQDHTWVGEQGLAWDVACAAVEWELDTSAQQILTASVAEVSGCMIGRRTLLLHRAGYCAFRLAAARHCGNIPAASSYEAELRHVLGCMEFVFADD